MAPRNKRFRDGFASPINKEYICVNMFKKRTCLIFFSVAGPVDVYLKLPVSEISKIDDQRSVRISLYHAHNIM